MSSTPQFNGDQLAAARSERWHQSGDALLTLEAAREWVGELGLVLFAPRAHQLAAPAPSLVEATLGRAVSAPSAAETETARGLVARMVAEGSALPLNLLGSAGDVPDFVVSAQAFSYVFTLRGEKNWKQPPGTSGAGSVSPLALKVYEALVAGNALTARELVSELGREVTESAIVRALGELWMQLRVIPLLQQDGAGTKDSGTTWELTTRRFTKQIKAGANAGQPTALSAAISLYLAQVYAATEEEIETFLSPLTARSKVRDVLHGLTAARQLENAVLEGKTLSYIPGALPEFPEVVAAEPVAGVGEIVAAAVGTLAGVVGAIAGAARIRKFDGPRPPRESRRAKIAGSVRSARRVVSVEDRASRLESVEGQRNRLVSGNLMHVRRARLRARVLENESGGRFSVKVLAVSGQSLRARGMKIGSRDRGVRRVSVLKENEPIARTTRAARVRRESFAEVRGRRVRIAGRARNVRFGRVREGEGFASRPSKPFRPRREGEGEGFASRPSKPYKARGEGDRAGFGSRPAKPFRPRGEGESKPFRPRREGEREGSASRPSRPYKARGEGDRAAFGSRPAKPFRPRGEGEREGSASRPSKPYKARREGGRAGYASRESKPFRPRREGEGEGFASRPARPYKPRAEGDRGTAEKRPYRRAEGGDRPRSTGDRKPGGKAGFGGKATFGAKKKFGGGEKKFGGERKFAIRRQGGCEGTVCRQAEAEVWGKRWQEGGTANGDV